MSLFILLVTLIKMKRERNEIERKIVSVKITTRILSINFPTKWEIAVFISVFEEKKKNIFANEHVDSQHHFFVVVVECPRAATPLIFYVIIPGEIYLKH